MRVEHRKSTKGYFEDGNFVEKFRQDIMIPDRSFSHLKKNESAKIYSQFEETVDVGNEKLRLISGGEFYSDYTLYGKINGGLSDEDYKYFLENSDLERQAALMQMGGWALTSSNAVSHCLVEQHIPEVPENVYLPTADDLRLRFKHFELERAGNEPNIRMSAKKGLLLSEINSILSELKKYTDKKPYGVVDPTSFIRAAYGHISTEDIDAFIDFIRFIQAAKYFEPSTFGGSGNQPQ